MLLFITFLKCAWMPTHAHMHTHTNANTLGTFFMCRLIYHTLFFILTAFTFFSTLEYAIAITNICFHFTAILEFDDWYMLVGQPIGTEKQDSTIQNSDISGINKKKN